MVNNLRGYKMADTIKCPHCAANLKFAAGVQKLQCPYCGGVFGLDEIKYDVEELVTESKPVEKTETPAETQTGNEAPSDPENKIVMEHLEAIEGEGVSDADNVEFVCNSCGGKVLSDASTSASFCPFCGSPAIIGQRLSGQFKPKYIIPFKYDREAAEAAFIKWCKGGKYTPVKFVSKENVAKLTGLYVPFWLFDVKGKVHIEGTAQTSSTSGNYTIINDYSYSLNGDLDWLKVPFDGETRIDDDLMEAIEPFNYKEMVPYDYKYLPGFFADRYDQSDVQLERRVRDTCHKYLDAEVGTKLKKYNTHKMLINNTTLTPVNAEYALLPVWFMQYKYLGKSYYFAMNGQTGEVAGKAPVSKVKQIMFYSVTLAVLSVIARFIAGLIMGGHVG